MLAMYCKADYVAQPSLVLSHGVLDVLLYSQYESNHIGKFNGTYKISIAQG